MSVALVTAETPVTTVTTNRRQDDRYKVRCNALVTVFDFEEPFQGMLVNVSDGGAQLTLDRPVPLSSLVKIECTDFLLLGDAVYCQQEQGNWLVGIHVEHGLYGLKALAEAIQESWR